MLALSGALLALAALFILAAPAHADIFEYFDINATFPLTPTEGSEVTLNLSLTNKVNVSYTNLVVIFQQGSTEIEGTRLSAVEVDALGTLNITVTFTAAIPNVIDNNAGLKITVFGTGTPPHQYGQRLFSEFRVKERPPPAGPDYLTPLLIIGVGGVGGVGGFLYMRKRKERMAQEAAEAAARAQVEANVKAERAREAALLAKIGGKHPPEYYVRRRARLGLMIPVGLTGGGTTILGIKQKLSVAETKQMFSCPRCGTRREVLEAPCPRCAMADGIDALKAETKKHKGHDFSDVSNLIQQAEFQVSFSDFEQAGANLETARQVFSEILAGGERKTQVKRLETIRATDHAPKVLDIGIKTEHTLVDMAAEEKEHEAREAYAAGGSNCPTCGHAMYGDLCAYCHFDDYARLVEEAAAKASAAGGESLEARELLSRGRTMREEGQKETAARYLNRARFLAITGLRQYLDQKAEGMIDYARVLMMAGEEDGVAADFGEAELLINEADARRAAGDPQAAFDLVSQAETKIQTALHDMAKHVALKRIDVVAVEIDEAREKGVQVKAAEERLKDARASFDGGEFESARDAATTARKALEEASRGKSQCPNCKKPVQPTWARCPYCTTPLK